MEVYSLPSQPPRQCDRCGGPIWEEEICYRIDGYWICALCLADFAADYFADRVETPGRI